MPRLVQGALARQKKGAWDLTLANAWGVLAMEKFSRAFENVPVSGVTRADLSPQSLATDWQASPEGRISSFSWPAHKEELVISHEGTGKPWATVQSLAAIPLKEALSSGYKIKKAIIDKNVEIPAGMTIGFEPAEDKRRFHVTPEGVVVIPKGMKVG